MYKRTNGQMDKRTNGQNLMGVFVVKFDETSFFRNRCVLTNFVNVCLTETNLGSPCANMKPLKKCFKKFCFEVRFTELKTFYQSFPN